MFASLLLSWACVARAAAIYVRARSAVGRRVIDGIKRTLLHTKYANLGESRPLLLLLGSSGHYTTRRRYTIALLLGRRKLLPRRLRSPGRLGRRRLLPRRLQSRGRLDAVQRPVALKPRRVLHRARQRVLLQAAHCTSVRVLAQEHVALERSLRHSNYSCRFQRLTCRVRQAPCL